MIEHWCTYCQGANAHNCQFNANVPRQHVYITNSTAHPAQAEAVPPDVVRDAERWRTFLATRPANTHAVINDAIDAATAKGEKS